MSFGVVLDSTNMVMFVLIVNLLRWLDTVLKKLSNSLLNTFNFCTVKFKQDRIEFFMYFNIISFKLWQF